MNNSPPLSYDSTSAGMDQQLDRLCDRFEESWQTGRRPSIEEYLAETLPSAGPLLLAELLALELTYRRDRNEHPEEMEYRQRFPQYDKVVQAAFAKAPELIPQATPELLVKWKFSWLLNKALTPSAYDDTITAPPDLRDGLTETETKVADHAADTPHLPAKATRGDKAALANLERDYIFLGRLGKGGMGVVYKAFDRRTKRIVALKVIRPDRLEGVTELERQAWIESFRRAAELTGKLEHDHIVPLYHLGEERGQFYYVMRYIEGRSLGEIVREDGPLTKMRAARYMEAMARAVDFAHGHGVLHVDLKPRNMLVDARTDVVYLADFGLARPLEAVPETQSTMGAIGTYPYIAPEQAQARPKFHVPGDVYGLGASLYDLVTGKPPFRDADPVETLRQVREEEPVSPRRLNPAVDRDLETIILKCLCKEPSQRYGSAAALADDLASYQLGKPIKARPVGKIERTWRWCRRNPKQALSYSAAVLALFSITALTTYAWHTHRVAVAQKAAADASAWRERGQEQCERGHIALGLLWKARGLDLAPKPDADLENYARLDLAAWSQSVHELKTFLPHGGHLRAAAFSPDGKVVVTGNEQGHVQVWEVATGNPRFAAPMQCSAEIRVLVVSADSRNLAIVGDKGIELRELSSGMSRITFQSPSMGPVLAATFRDDGRIFLAAFSDGKIHRWTTDTGDYLGSLPTTAGVASVVAFNTKHNTVLVGHKDGTAQMWNLDTGKLVGSPMKHGDDPVLSAVFSSDGETAFTGSGWPQTARGAVYQWRANSGEPVSRLPTSLNGIAKSLAVSPDGARVFITTEDDSRELLTWDLTTNRLSSSFPLHKHVHVVSFSTDCRHFLTGGSDDADLVARVGLWTTASGPRFDETIRFTGDIDAIARDAADLTTLAAGPRGATIWRKEAGPPVALGRREPVFAVALSPDGETAATAGYKGIQLWDTTTGIELMPLEDSNTLITKLAINPSGTQIAGVTKKGFWVWNVASRKMICNKEGMSVTAIAFNPSGEVVTGNWEGEVQKWEIPSGKQVGVSVRHEGAVYGIAISPNGKLILTGSGDSTAQIWDSTTGAPIGPPLVHSGRVQTVAFSSDGRLAATGSTDGIARLWDVATGKPIGPPFVHPLRVSGVDFSRDGKALMTTGDELVRAWRIEPPLSDAAVKLRQRIEVHSGLELSPRGSVRQLDDTEWRIRRANLGLAVNTSN